MAPRQSDEPDENDGSGRDGQFLGEDLAKAVTITPALRALATDEQIGDDDELQQLLLDRLHAGYSTRYMDADRVGDIAEVIVDSLPTEMRTKAVMAGMDLRPYLVALNGKRIVQRTEGGMAPWDRDSTHTVKVDTTDILANEQAKVESDFMKLSLSSDLSDEERTRIAKSSTVLSGNNVDVVPAAKPTAPTVAVGEASPDLLAAGQNALGGQALFPVDGLTEALQSGMMDFENLVSEEAAQSAELGGGFYPMNLGPDGNTSISGGPGGNSIDRGQAPPQQYAGPTQMMSAAKAKNWLSTLTEKEVANLQMKMAAAGYFDRVDGGAAYLEGDAYDPITMKAWTMLLTETAQQKEAMPMVLARNMRDYRAKRQQANMRQLNEFDATMSRVQANDFAHSVIGRGLSSTEAQALEEFLLGLREQRSGYVAGAVNPAGQLPNADGYDNRDIESFINRNNGDEQMSNYQGELLYTMNKRFGG